MSEPSTPAAVPPQRLHPLSPLLRGIKSLWVVIAALSWQGFERFGVDVGAIIVACGGVLALGWSWVTWRFTGFEVVGRELRIHEGVLVRRNRTIPLERLQTVEVVQPLLARLTGLAELRLEVVGASKTEAPLAFLALAEARALRTRLLELSRSLETTDTAENGTADGHARVAVTVPTPPAITVPPRRLLLSQLLTPQVFVLPVAIVFTIGAFVLQPDLSFFGIAGLITATFGIAVKPVRQAMTNYDFTLHDTTDGLRIRRGLTEKRTQTLPLARVSAVVLRWPLLWRPARWVTARATHAGHGQQSSEELAGGTLLPVGSIEQARTVTTMALSGVDVLESRPKPVPRRARWLAPLTWRILGAALDPEVFVTRRGRFTRTLIAVPYARIQSVRVVQGRLQRPLRLATVHVDIAGGVSLSPRASHRDVNDALWMAEELRAKARNVATTDPSPHRSYDGPV